MKDDDDYGDEDIVGELKDNEDIREIVWNSVKKENPELENRIARGKRQVPTR